MSLARVSILLCCLAAAAVPAGESERPKENPLDKKISASFVEVPLDAVCRFISESSGLKVTCDDALAKAPITASFKDTALGAALKSVARSAGGELMFVKNEGALAGATIVKKAGGGKPAGPMSAAMVKEFEAKLDKKVNVDFKAVPVTEALTFVQIVAELSMVVDPGVSTKATKTITLKAEKVPLREVLDKTLEAGELKREYRDGAIYVTPKDPPKPPATKDEKK
jgi:type II secretory pathway component GspD/PulD (secretin)